MKIRLPARLFKAGDYPDKQFKASAGDLDAIVGATRGRTKPLELDLHHADTDETFDLGKVPPDTIRREGDWIVGDVEVEQSDIDGGRFKKRGLSVVIDRATKAISKVTVTGRPRVAGAGFEQQTESGAWVFDGGYLMDPKDEKGQGAAEEPTVEPTPALSEEDRGLLAWLKNLRNGFKPADAQPAALSNDALDAAIAKAVTAATAEFDTKLAARDAEIKALKEQSAEFGDERIATEVTRAIMGGVPPVIAEQLVPLAFGRTEIAFTDGEGKPQTRTVAEAAGQVLAFCMKPNGGIPRGKQLGFTDGQEAVEFDERSANLAKEKEAAARAAGHPITFAEAQRLADDELLRKEA